VNLFRLAARDETNPADDEAVSPFQRKYPETSGSYAQIETQQRGSVMWAFINMLYREYCRASLAAIRKFEPIH
jgi:hypothetical protein